MSPGCQQAHLGGPPRVAVVIPCYNDGAFLDEAVGSINETEPVEIVVVDDASDDAVTRHVLEQLARGGPRIVWHECNQGAPAAKASGLRATTARYVFPLDADDRAVPGMLAVMADRLDRSPDAVVCFGDYAEFGSRAAVVHVPARLDPYRIAFRNQFGASALFRRDALEAVGGWSPGSGDVGIGYEDWHVWMGLAERGWHGLHAGKGAITYERRVHPGRRLARDLRPRHRRLYEQLRQLHPDLFTQLARHKRESDLSRIAKLLYPALFGPRPPFAFESDVRAWLSRVGIRVP
jgi:glycosyltransferase involved in cell wall biosynthesis